MNLFYIKLFIFIVYLISFFFPHTLFSKDNTKEDEEDIGYIKSNIASITGKREGPSPDKIDFIANSIEYNFQDNIMVATGDVKFSSENQMLQADRVFYNAENNLIFAEGNVHFKDSKGNDFYAQSLEIDSELEAGIIKDFEILFKDDARLSAKLLNKRNEEHYNIRSACYTNCKSQGDSSSTWRLRASKGVYNTSEETVTFYNTWLEIKNIPIFWSPFLHFSNLMFERKMGLLTPELKNTSTYGNALVIPLYIPLRNTQDVIIKTYLVTSSKLGINTFRNTKIPIISSTPILYTANYKGYIDYGYFNLNAGYTTKTRDEGNNWHYFLGLNREFNDIWRTNLNLQQTSDNSYLNRYDINPKDSSESFLTNNITLNGFFDNNNYISLKGYGYKYINSTFNTSGVPEADISLDYKYLGDYSKYGRFNFTTAISRFNFSSGDALSRVALNGDYKFYKSDISGNYSLNLEIQSTSYSSAGNSQFTSKDVHYTAVATSLTWDYPLIHFLERSNITFSPVVQMTIATHLDKNKNVATVDSFLSNTTTNNLFNSNHYSGYDIFEDAQNVKYGFELSYLDLNNRGGRIFFGQIINIDSLTNLLGDTYLQNNPVYLQENKSNYYISVDLAFANNFYLSYEGIIDLSYRNIEDNARIGYRNRLWGFNITHSSYNGLDPKLFTYTNIEEITGNGNINITQNLSFNTSATYSSNNTIPLGLSSVNYNLRWINDCLDIRAYLKRSFYETITDSYGIKIKISGVG